MIAIIVAAGSSRRMGFDKLTAELLGRPVVAHSLLAFEACTVVEQIILVTREDRVAEFEAVAREQGITKLACVLPGGSERHFSVAKGLEAALAQGVRGARGDRETYIAVHDAARPLITPAAIAACLEAARQRRGAASCAAPVADTLKRADSEGVVTESVDRTQLWAMQTPQIFHAALLSRAYQAVLESGTLVTDEVSAVQALGVDVALYQNDEPNFKITLPRDLHLARLVLADRA